MPDAIGGPVYLDLTDTESLQLDTWPPEPQIGTDLMVAMTCLDQDAAVYLILNEQEITMLIDALGVMRATVVRHRLQRDPQDAA